MKIFHETKQTAFSSCSGFVHEYQRLIKETVIPYQYSVLCDEAEGAEKSHVIKNFINAGRALRNEDTGDGFYGMVFQDSDAAKWLEAVAYSLALFPDNELEKTADNLIDIIADAQDEDGYLNTYFTVKDKEKRWTNLLEGHEMYCSGHMIEAACAYYEATGKDKLLKVMERNVEHIYKLFITEKKEGYPGHPEIELALLKMYRLTKNGHALELARHFIDVRGVDTEFYRKEKQKRSWTVWGNNAEDNIYQQSYAPVREMDTACGHAVRAVYLYTAMAELAAIDGDKELENACRRLWQSIVGSQMYITGGIGSTVHGEAFSVPYDLPGDTAYSETCAAIGLMFYAQKMLEMTADGSYADVMERAFYNAVLGGMQLDGKRFFYVNPLEAVPGISNKTANHHHVVITRPKWYACACCPPNVARLVSSLGKYAYGENGDTAFCNLFAEGDITFENGVRLSCKTGYPFETDITYTVAAGGRIAIRIPSYSKCFTVTVNGNEADAKPDKGYVYITVSDGDTIKVTLDGSVRSMHADPKVPRLSGMTALERGPLVYCFEGVDNGGDVLSLSLKKDGEKKLVNKADTPAGVPMIEAKALKTSDSVSLYSAEPLRYTECTAYAVPYYTWANRGENQMRVWMPEK